MTKHRSLLIAAAIAGVVASASPSAHAAGTFNVANSPPLPLLSVTSLAPNWGLIAIGINSAGTPPACATTRNWLIVDLRTEQGRSAFNMANSAFLAGLKVAMVGNGTCTTVSLPNGTTTPTSATAENLGYIVMNSTLR